MDHAAAHQARIDKFKSTKHADMTDNKVLSMLMAKLKRGEITQGEFDAITQKNRLFFEEGGVFGEELDPSQVEELELSAEQRQDDHNPTLIRKAWSRFGFGPKSPMSWQKQRLKTRRAQQKKEGGHGAGSTARRSKARRSKARRSKARRSKARRSKARRSKARRSKARRSKARRSRTRRQRGGDCGCTKGA